VHGGGQFGARSSGGTATIPPPGAAFTSTTDLPSRQVPSWYFGDGAAFFNSLPESFRVSAITPLDPALSTGPDSASGGTFGVRTDYSFTPRVSGEFTVDYGLEHLDISDETLAQVEASRASFVTAMTNVFTVVTAPAVTSVATVNEKSHQLALTGAIRVKLTRERRLTPFVVGGFGVINGIGDNPSISLLGTYKFTVIGTYSQSDHVTLEYRDSHDFVAVAGGGFTYALSRRTGVRVDIRALIGKNSGETRVSTLALNTSAGSVIASFTTPSLQISSSPVLPSTLSGAITLHDVRTFEGSGVASELTTTAGWYVRF
jgi:hypothetical protein